MNPLDRALQRRRARVARLSVAALVLCVASAGVLVPPVLRNRAYAANAAIELEMNAVIIRLGSDVQRFETHGLAVLEDAERRFASLAPAELPSTFRRTVKERLERLGARVDVVEPGAPRAVEMPANGLETVASFAATDVSIAGSAPFAVLPALVRELEGGAPPGLVRDVVIARSDERFPDVTFSFVVAVLHLLPEPVAEEDDSGAAAEDEP